MIMNDEAYNIQHVLTTLASFAGFLRGSDLDYYMRVLRNGSVNTDDELLLLACEVLDDK